MNTSASFKNARGAKTTLAALSMLLLALHGHAAYKVVGPDGKVTYTDRPPITERGNKITALGAGGAAVAESVALPLELRQAVSRYPVTLYVTSNCEPCDTGRSLLRQRGIPHTEKQVLSGEDSDALLRMSGSRDAPTLMIGSQAVRGLAPDVWASYLDAAGYPRESRLPANYQFPAATPLTERKDTAEAAAQRLPGPNLRQDPPTPAPDTGPKIKF